MNMKCCVSLMMAAEANVRDRRAHRAGQRPWVIECEAFLFTHVIIDNLGFILGGEESSPT